MPYRNPENQARIMAVLGAHGPLTQCEDVPAELIARYEGLVPDLILDLWENHGIGELAGGLVRFCIPDMFAQPVAMLFDGDPDYHPGTDTFVLAYGPFGSLAIWNDKHLIGLLSHPSAALDVPFYDRAEPGIDRDAVAFDYFLNADPRIMDVFDDRGEEMFTRAKTALGPLQPGLIYGLMPPDDFHDVDVGNIQVTVAEEWLESRFSAQVYSIHDMINDRLNIRPVGRA